MDTIKIITIIGTVVVVYIAYNYYVKYFKTKIPQMPKRFAHRV